MKSTFKYKNRWSRLKGLAIIGVVSGHICHLTLPLMEIFVNYWHLPVFFFIGGYFLKEKHFQAPRKYIGSRFKRLIIPFIIMAIFLAILHNPLLSAGLITGDEYTISSLPAILKKMMLLSVNEYLMGAMWFTPVLFFVSILAFFLLRNIRNNRTLCLVALAVSLIVIMLCVYLLPAYHKIWGRVATVWIFILGFIVSSIGLKKWMNEPWVIVVSWLIIILALVDGRFVGCQINEAVNWPLWAPLVFVAGILIAYNVAMIMDGSVVGNIIGFIGDFSFSIMAFHFIGFNLVNYSRSLFFDGVNVSAFPIDISDFYYWMPVYFLVGIAFPILLSLSYAKTKQAIKNRISILDNNHIV